MAEYINREELIANLNKFAPEHLTPLIMNLIDKQPTADVVEVVRCKDCKHRRKTAFRSYCLPVFGLKQITDLNAYCSYGERKQKNDFKE